MFKWSFKAIKTSCVSKAKRAGRWMMGQRFPPGFDEWCRISEPPAGWTDVGADNHQSDHDAIEGFIQSVTRPGAHWRSLTITSRHSQNEWDFQFHADQASRFNQLTMDTTDVWNLETGGQFGAFRMSGLTVRNVNLHIEACPNPTQLTNCVIGRLHLTDRSGSAYKISLELHDCWVGTLVIPQATLKNLSISGGGVAHIDCPPADGNNPFTGAVTFKKVFFPTSQCQTRLFEGPQAYRSLHAHLMKHDNVLMANLIRAKQLRSEREIERGFAWFTNWFYGTFAKYGTSPGRPLFVLAALYVFSMLLGWWLRDYGHLTRPLLGDAGRVVRLFLLPLQSIVNPFGTLFDATRFIFPDTWQFNVWLVFQGLFSDFMLLLAGLSIRRRFKAG